MACMRERCRPFLALAILMLTQFACGQESPTGPSGVFSVRLEAATIRAGGDTVALLARALDSKDRAVQGQRVEWSLRFSDGTAASGLKYPASESDSYGVARNVLVVGDTAQDYLLIASAASARDSLVVTFDPVSLAVEVLSNEIAWGDTVTVRLVAEDALGRRLPIPRPSISALSNAQVVPDGRLVINGGPSAAVSVACCGRQIFHFIDVGTRVKVRAATLDGLSRTIRIALRFGTLADTISVPTDTLVSAWTSRYLTPGAVSVDIFDPDVSAAGLYRTEATISSWDRGYTLRPLLVPRIWTVKRGSYAGVKVDIDLLKMFAGGNDRLSTLPNLGQNGSPVVRPSSSFPIPVTIDTGRFVIIPTPYYPSDSIALGRLIDEFNARVGFTAFRIVSRASFTVDSLQTPSGSFIRFWRGGALVRQEGALGPYAWGVSTECSLSNGLSVGLPCPLGGEILFASVTSSFAVPDPSEVTVDNGFDRWFLRFLGLGRSCYGEVSALFNPADCASYAVPDFPEDATAGVRSAVATAADVAHYEMLEMLGVTFPLVSPTWSMAAVVQTAWIDRFGALPTCCRGVTGFYPRR